ncbi:MAG: YggS family pyridoxal phosphate-dependent enzyme [bacterium]
MIKKNIENLLKQIPETVELVGATKTRTSEEILEAIEGGLKIIGENYIQEAEKKFKIIGNKVKWHFIGHLQKNKVKKAAKIFDLIETIDSFEIAQIISEECFKIGKQMQILIEINSGKEIQKFGVFSSEIEDLIKKINMLKNIKIMGLMTMGTLEENSENLRLQFKETKELFEKSKKLNLENVEMKYLSMGMSNSYQIAIEEGANIIRIGTYIFGKRNTSL